jgi:ADP-ribosylglycohydrolase
MALVDAIAETGRCDLNVYFEALRAVDLNATPSPPELGLTTGRVIAALRDGTYAGGGPSRSCGPATRAVAVGLFLYPLHTDVVWDHAQEMADVTHTDRVAKAVASVVACMIARIVLYRARGENVSVADMIAFAIDLLRAHEGARTSNPVEAFVGQARLSRWDTVLPFDHSADSLSVLCSSLAILVCSRANLADAAFLSAMSGGDTDSIGTIAGAICGAMHGVESIPSQWLRSKDGATLANSKPTIASARRLLETRLRDIPPPRSAFGTRRVEKHVIDAPRTRQRILRRLKAEGFVSMGDLYDEFEQTAIDLDAILPEFDDRVIVAPKGLYWIAVDRAHQYGPDYMRYARGTAQRSLVSTVMLEQYVTSNEANVRDSLANLLEEVGDDDAARSLQQRHPGHAAGIRTRLTFELLGQAIEACSDQVVEGQPVNLQIIFAESGADLGLQRLGRQRMAHVADLLAEEKGRRLALLTRHLAEPGAFILYTDGRLEGPFALLKADGLPEASAPFPASDYPLLNISQRAKTLMSVVISPLHGWVHTFRAGTCIDATRHFERDRHKYVTTSGAIVSERTFDVGQVVDSFLPRDALGRTCMRLLCVCLEHAAHSNHGGAFVVLPRLPKSGGYSGPWTHDADLGDSGSLDAWRLSEIRDILSRDGAVVLDGQAGRVLDFGVTLPCPREMEDVAMMRSGDILGRHGKRHTSAAVSTLEVPGAIAFVVSERGTITAFRDGHVMLRAE